MPEGGKPEVIVVFHWPQAGWNYINTLGIDREFGRDFWEIVERHGLPGIITHSSQCECGECPAHPLAVIRKNLHEHAAKQDGDDDA